jgi:hypothetical protein
MRARTALLVLASLSACAGPATSKTERTSEPRAAYARPESDPAARGTPQGASEPLHIEQVSVRVRRVPDGRLTIVEFLSPGLPEAEQVALRLAFEEGKFRVADHGAAGEESWITTLLRTGAR